MHLPLGSEKGVDVVVGEEVRCPVRPVDNPQCPAVANVRPQGRWQDGRVTRRWLDVSRKVQDIGYAQGAAHVATELAEREGGF